MLLTLRKSLPPEPLINDDGLVIAVEEWKCGQCDHCAESYGRHGISFTCPSLNPAGAGGADWRGRAREWGAGETGSGKSGRSGRRRRGGRRGRRRGRGGLKMLLNVIPSRFRTWRPMFKGISILHQVELPDAEVHCYAMHCSPAPKTDGCPRWRHRGWGLWHLWKRPSRCGPQR